MKLSYELAKRIIDVFFSALFILLFWWVFVALATLVRVKLGSPVLFKQERPGLNGEIFTLYKFRTMTDAVDADGRLLPDNQRLPTFGRRLRSTSLDELPEIFNILKGDMSFVGPRPLLVEYLPLYTDWQKRRHEVRPGLTGLAQCSGRNLLTWEERFALDVDYVDRCSFGLDAKIVSKTVLAVLRRDGVSSGTSVTMEPFRGSGAVDEDGE
ncbi:sugar transferase [Adlercreutzia muris]|uniref:sugar transferase n=1 Tax=Adlercreutzia muris TaxID=1796610 RepID=UPI0023ECAA00|nr:sugar transferase [Adlercreutzia muris]